MRALTSTLHECRLHAVTAEELSSLGSIGETLGLLLDRYEGISRDQGVADRALTLALARERVSDVEGPVLLLDPVTVNLADGRFLKMAVGFQMPLGTLIDEIEAENPATPALSYLIEQMRLKTSKNLGPKDLGHIREDLGYKVCVSPELNAEGKISTIYFTEFVAD